VQISGVCNLQQSHFVCKISESLKISSFRIHSNIFFTTNKVQVAKGKQYFVNQPMNPFESPNFQPV